MSSNADSLCLILAAVDPTQTIKTQTDGFGYIRTPDLKMRRTAGQPEWGVSPQHPEVCSECNPTVEYRTLASRISAGRERAHRIKRVRRCRSHRSPRETRPEPQRLRERSSFEDTRGIGRDGPEKPPTSNRAAFPASAQASPHEPAHSTSSDHLKSMVLDFHDSFLITQSLSQFFECFLFPSRHSLRR